MLRRLTNVLRFVRDKSKLKAVREKKRGALIKDDITQKPYEFLQALRHSVGELHLLFTFLFYASMKRTGYKVTSKNIERNSDIKT